MQRNGKLPLQSFRTFTLKPFWQRFNNVIRFRERRRLDVSRPLAKNDHKASRFLANALTVPNYRLRSTINLHYQKLARCSKIIHESGPVRVPLITIENTLSEEGLSFLACLGDAMAQNNVVSYLTVKKMEQESKPATTTKQPKRRVSFAAEAPETQN